MLAYTDLKDGIRTAPRQYLPALLILVAEQAIIKDCFVPGGVINTVTNVEKKIQADREGVEFKKNEPKKAELTCARCGASFTLDESYIHRRCGLSGCSGTLHLFSNN